MAARGWALEAVQGAPESCEEVVAPAVLQERVQWDTLGFILEKTNPAGSAAGTGWTRGTLKVNSVLMKSFFRLEDGCSLGQNLGGSGGGDSPGAGTAQAW